MEMKQALVTMREWFDNPRHWCQEVIGHTDLNGNVEDTCLIGGANLVCWDRLGHKQEFITRDQFTLRERILTLLYKHIGLYSAMALAEWNDSRYRTVEDIQTLLDEVILRLDIEEMEQLVPEELLV